MGKNISIYLHDDELKWLDQLCEEWGLKKGRKNGRSEAIQFVLKQSQQWSKALIPLLQGEKSNVAADLKRMLRDSEE